VPALILRTPYYRLDEPSGQAVVTLGGRDLHAGPCGSPASREGHDRRLASQPSDGRRLASPSPAPDSDPSVNADSRLGDVGGEPDLRAGSARDLGVHVA
jgi:hypothetical protein